MISVRGLTLLRQTLNAVVRQPQRRAGRLWLDIVLVLSMLTATARDHPIRFHRGGCAERWMSR